MTMISHITYRWSWSLSWASREAGDWKYQAMACAAPDTAAAATPASRETTFAPLIYPVPGSDPQSFRELGAKLDARLDGVELDPFVIGIE
jgi:hypothetical protein